MNPKKHKAKNRRRARALADEAWEAANQGNLDLAEKIIRRSVATQEDNPVLWNDQGVILGLRQKDSEAAKSFMAALSLTPTFADAYAHLAALRLRQGRLEETVVLQTQAVKYAPRNPAYAEQLQAYQALAGQMPETDSASAPLHETAEVTNTFSAAAPGTRELSEAAEEPIPAEKVSVLLPANDWEEQLATLDWHTLSNRLTREGYVVIAGLVDAATCEWLRGLFDEERLFAKTIVMDRPEFGKGVYRYFSAPIPKPVDQLRRAIYPHVAQIANEWRKMLGEAETFPEEWDAFRDRCYQAGQTMETPILLKYGPGGFNALHRDLRGSVYFPIQLAVVLSPRAAAGDAATQLGSPRADVRDVASQRSAPIPCTRGRGQGEGAESPTHLSQAHGFQGGEFLFCDSGEGRKARRREISLGLGDAVLFCSRDRLVRTGGMVGLQPVKHGAGLITSGTRFVLGVPFHEYR
jgi:hypothetical protein